MIKGARKNMIVVKTSDSLVFEEAYFVMRESESRDHDDMITEAGRIIEGCTVKKSKTAKGQFKNMLIGAISFFGGAFLGSGAAVLIFLFA